MALVRARKKHNERIKNGEDTSAIVQTTAQLEHDLALQRAERTRLRAEALLLGLVQAQRRKQLDDADAAFVQEIERMLTEPATMDEERLAEIARETRDTWIHHLDVQLPPIELIGLPFAQAPAE